MTIGCLENNIGLSIPRIRYTEGLMDRPSRLTCYSKDRSYRGRITGLSGGVKIGLLLKGDD